MSVVTDILLCTAVSDRDIFGEQITESEHPNADLLNEWIVEEYGPACSLVKLDDYAIGNKRMQADVFGVAINYCDTDALVAAFRAIRWTWPESAQLFVKEEHWDAFRVFTPSA